MEVILNLRPIEIEAEAKAVLTAGRLRRNQDWRLEPNKKTPTTAFYLETLINSKYPHLDYPTVHGKKTLCHTFFNCVIDDDARSKEIEVTPENPDKIHL